MRPVPAGVVEVASNVFHCIAATTCAPPMGTII
jgi:hypothetical protein